MQHILATLEGPAPYYGFGVHYASETAPERFIPDEVSVSSIYRRPDGEDNTLRTVVVRRRRPHEPADPHALDPENTKVSLPLLEGASIRLVYEAHSAIVGLIAWFLRPDA